MASGGHSKMAATPDSCLQFRIYSCALHIYSSVTEPSEPAVNSKLNHLRTETKWRRLRTNCNKVGMAANK